MDKDLVSVLEKALPSCSLIYGTGSDFSLARYLRDYYDVCPVDYLERDKLLVRDVGTIKRICNVSASGQFKFVVASLKNASSSAINDLLILLESPPKHVKFMFMADAKVLPTLESRCAVYELGLAGLRDRDFSSNAYYVVEALETGNKTLLEELLKTLDGRSAHQIARVLGDKAVTSTGAQELLTLASGFNSSSLVLCFKSFLPNFLGRI